MDISELVVGELYAYRNSRCRLERTWLDSDGFAHAEISLGRSFDRRQEVRTHPYMTFRKTDIRDLRDTWEGYKQGKLDAKSKKEKAKNLSSRFREALAEYDITGWVYADGQMHLHGELDSLERLLERIEAGRDRSLEGNALAEILEGK